jgi:hypothetical protein
MRRPDFLTTQICIRLSEDRKGFTYCVRRFGVSGPRRFVATSTDAGIQPPADSPVPRAKSHSTPTNNRKAEDAG